MSSPPVKYLRYFDFTTFASVNPEKPLPGGSVDVEFNRLKSTTDQTIDRLNLIQRDDGLLRDGAITTNSLADGSVTTPKLADAAVTQIKIAANSITNIHIITGAVDNRTLADGSVTGSKIAVNGVSTAQLADGCVTHPKIGFAAVDNTNLAIGAVTSSIIGNNQVLTQHLADQSVTTPKIGLAAVGYGQLAPNAVNSIILAPNAAGTIHIIDLAVTTPKLADGAVTSAKIAPGTVIPGGIPPGYITNSMLGPNSVGTANIIDGSVTLSKMAPNSVNGANIVDGSIDPIDLSPTTVALMTAAGNPRGAWLTGTNYATKDAVTQGSGVFVCITAHVSGVFATDLAAGKWYQTGQIFDQMLNTTSTPQFLRVGIGKAAHATNPLDMLLNQPAATLAQLTNTDGGAAASAQFRATNLNTSVDFGVYGSGFTAAGPAHPGYGFINAYGGGLVLNSVAAGSILLATNNVVRMTLDVNGSLGIGRTPQNWALTYKTINLGPTASIISVDFGGSNSTLQLSDNAWYDGSTWRAVQNTLACLYALADGAHIWYKPQALAAAGAPLNFLEVMRLDANGYFGLGTIGSATYPVDILSGTAGSCIGRMKNSVGSPSSSGGFAGEADSGAGVVMQMYSNTFATSGNIRAQGGLFYSNGAGGVSLISAGGGTTINISAGGISGGVYLPAGGTAWAVVSAEASKRDLRELPGDVFHMIANHRVRVGRYNDDDDSVPERPFLLFEDTERYYPWASAYQPARDVEATDSDGKNPVTIHYPEMKGISLELYVPLLMRAMQLVDQRLKAGGL